MDEVVDLGRIDIQSFLGSKTSSAQAVQKDENVKITKKNRAFAPIEPPLETKIANTLSKQSDNGKALMLINFVYYYNQLHMRTMSWPRTALFLLFAGVCPALAASKSNVVVISEENKTLLPADESFDPTKRWTFRFEGRFVNFKVENWDSFLQQSSLRVHLERLQEKVSPIPFMPSELLDMFEHWDALVGKARMRYYEHLNLAEREWKISISLTVQKGESSERPKWRLFVQDSGHYFHYDDLLTVERHEGKAERFKRDVTRIIEVPVALQHKPEVLAQSIAEFHAYLKYLIFRLAESHPQETAILEKFAKEVPTVPRKKRVLGIRKKTRQIRATKYLEQVYGVYQELKLAKTRLSQLLDQMEINAVELENDFRDGFTEELGRLPMVIAGNSAAEAVLSKLGGEIAGLKFISAFESAYERNGQLKLELFPDVIVKPIGKPGLGIAQIRIDLKFIPDRGGEVVLGTTQVRFNSKIAHSSELHEDFGAWKEPLLEGLEEAAERLTRTLECQDLLLNK